MPLVSSCNDEVEWAYDNRGLWLLLCLLCCFCFLRVFFLFPPSTGPTSSPTAITRIQTSWLRPHRPLCSPRPPVLAASRAAAEGRQSNGLLRSFGPVQYMRNISRRITHSLSCACEVLIYILEWGPKDVGRPKDRLGQQREERPPCLTLLNFA